MQTFKTNYPDFTVKTGMRVQLYSVLSSGVLSYRIKRQRDQSHLFAGNASLASSGIRYYGTAIVHSVLPRAGIVMVALVAANVPTNRAELAGLLECAK